MSSTPDVVVWSRSRVVRRPSMRRAEPDSLTLNGMERTVTRTRAPKSTTIEAIIDMYGERPLPPVPRIPSSIYASGKRRTLLSFNLPASPESQGALALPPAPRTPSPASPRQEIHTIEKDSKSAKHLSQLSKKERRGKVNATNMFSIRQDSAQKTKNPNSPKAKVREAKPVPFTEWKAPTYKEPSVSSKSSPRSPLSQRSASFDSPRPSLSTWKAAGGRAASYFALIDPANRISLDKSRRVSSPLTESPSLPFADVNEAANQCTLPYSIRTHSLPETPPHSHFSPSSPSTSDIESSSNLASSLRSRAKKVLRPSKVIKRPGLKCMNSSQSDISCVSHITAPSYTTLASSHRRFSLQQSLGEVCNSLESMSRPSKGEIARPTLLRGDHSYPLMKKIPMRERRNKIMTLTQNQKHTKKNQEVSKSHPYVYRVPRKRLSKPQMPTASLTTKNTKSPDTTYKIKMPAPQAPKRPDSILLFGESYDVGKTSSEDPNAVHRVPAIHPTGSNMTKSHHLSRSFSGSASHHRRSHRLSRAEKHQPRRYSLPTSGHSRQNTDDSTLSGFEIRATDSNFAAENDSISVGQKLKTSLPILRLAKRDAESVPALDSERGRFRESEKRKERREGTGSVGRSVSAERRRNELKKRIRIMGDPSAVGVPF